MRVAIDLLPITGRNAGIQSYAKQLVHSLVRADQEVEYVLLVNARAGRLFDEVSRNVHVVAVRSPKHFIWYWEQPCLPMLHALRHVDLLHSPVSAPPHWVSCKKVVTVHDLTFKLFPDTMRWWDRFYWHIFLTQGLASVDRVIVPSLSTYADLRDTLSIPEDRIVVIRESCSEAFFQRLSGKAIAAAKMRYKIVGPYILTVATLEPRKNLTTLLKAFSIIKDDSALRLVVVGARGWRDQPIFDEAVRLGIEKDVIFTGFVADGDLPAIYQGAEVFVFPSLYEGFGLPPLEAMASSLPVVASTASAISEVVGDCGVLVDPRSAKAFSDAIIKLHNDEEVRYLLAAKGRQRAREFSPEEMAAKTIEVYREVAEVR